MSNCKRAEVTSSTMVRCLVKKSIALQLGLSQLLLLTLAKSLFCVTIERVPCQSSSIKPYMTVLH